MKPLDLARLSLARFVTTAVIVAFFIVPTETFGGQENIKRILLVESYSSLDPWTANSLKGFNETLTDAGIQAYYDTFSFEVRFQEGAKPLAYDIQVLQDRLNAIKYDLVVGFNNDTVDLFLNKQIQLPPDTPLLLDSFHGEITPRMQQELNMTGVTAAFDLNRTIQLGLQLLPDTAGIVLILGTTADDEAQLNILREESPELFNRVTIISGAEYTTSEMLQKVKELPQNSLLVFCSWNSLKESTVHYAYTVLPEINQNFRGMILGRYDSYMSMGSHGGITAISQQQGSQIGALAIKVLNGANVVQLPAESAQTHALLDYQALKKFNIPDSQLPAGLQIVNEPPDFIKHHSIELAVCAGLCLLLVAGSYFVQFIRRKEQKKFRMLLENLPQWILIVDRKNRVLYSHTPDSEAGWLDNSITRVEQLPESPSRQQFCAAIQEAFRSGKSVSVGIERNGKYRNDVYRSFSKKNPFRREVVMCISTDVTELHRAHQEAAQLAERHRLTLKSIGDGVIATAKDETVTLINPAAIALTGYSREQAIGMKMDDIFNIVSYIDGRRVESPLTKALSTGRAVELANHTDLIAKDGVRRHIADCASPIRDEAGNITGGVLVFRDVTAEYEKRDQLRRNDEILKKVEEIAKIGYFRCNTSGMPLQPPPEEYWPRPGGVAMPPEKWVAAKDLENFLTQWRKLLSRECDSISISYSAGTPSRYFELQMVKSAGETVALDEYYGVIQDVTHSRETEKQIRDSHQLLKNILDNLPGFLFVKNADDNFRYVLCNSRFAELTGKDYEQIPGLLDQDLFPMDEIAAKRFREDDQRVIDSQTKWNIREHATVVNGSEIIFQTIKTPLVQSDGTTLLLGLSIDVSREFQLEQEQKRTIDQLDHASRCERIINQSLSMITVEQDLDRAVNEMLRIIGENAHADRAYIFLNDSADGRYVSNKYEWVRDGVSTQREKLQKIDMNAYPEWQKGLANNRDIIIFDAENPPEAMQAELKMMRAQEIRSMLLSGIWHNDTLLGFVGLDYTRERYNFAESSIHMVKSISNLFLLARERAMQMDQLAESAQLSRQIIDNIAVPIAIIDMNGHFQAVNPSFQQMVGQAHNDFDEQKCYHVICRQSEVPSWCSMNPFKNTLTPMSHEMIVNDRKYIVNTQPIYDRQQGLRYALKSFVDITEITRQKEELQKAMDQAMAANRAKSYFLATMSHELRTPLNAVIGFSELLQSEGIDREEQLEYLRSINYAGAALLSLINDVLDLSKLEAEQMSISPSKTSLPEMLEELVSVFQLKARQKNLSLQLDNTPFRHPVYVDHQRIRQILLNLIGNAIKFTHAGGVTVQVEFTSAAPEENVGTLCIRVIDTGIGIPEEQAQKIFDPFFQAETTRDSHAYEGSGLGLAISTRLAQRMGGTLAVTTRLGAGSTFTLTLYNIHYETDSAPAPLGSEPPKPIAQPCRLRILLVDDIPMNLKVLEAMLKKLNAECVCAQSGMEALKILESDRNFDFIMTDLWMPEMNGDQLADRIHSQKELDKITVIAVTADTEAKNNFSTDFFDNILAKPITFEKLQRLLASRQP